MGITEAVHVSGGEIHDLWFAHSEDIFQYNSKMICWYFDCISIFQFNSQPFLTFHFALVNCQKKISGKYDNGLQIPRVFQVARSLPFRGLGARMETFSKLRSGF